MGGIKSAAKWIMIMMRLGLPKNRNCSVYHGEKLNFWPVEKKWQWPKPGCRTKVRKVLVCVMCRLFFPKVLISFIISQYNFATVIDSIPASSDTEETEGGR